MVGAWRNQPADRGHGAPFRTAWRHDAAARPGGPCAHAGQAGDRGRNAFGLARTVRCRRQQCRHHAQLQGPAVRLQARRGLFAQPVAQELQPLPVRGAFRHRGQLAGHPAPHDPVRPTLQRPARRHLRSWRAATGLFDLPAPSDRNRPVDGARRHEHFLRAGPRRPHGQAGGRLGGDGPAAREAHSRRARATPDPGYPFAHRHQVPLRPARFRDGSERAYGQCLQPRAGADTKRMVPRA